MSNFLKKLEYSIEYFLKKYLPFLLPDYLKKNRQMAKISQKRRRKETLLGGGEVMGSAS